MQKYNKASSAISLYVMGLCMSGPVLVAGCGGNSDKAEMVKPAEPINVTAKDSMQYYRDNMPHKGKKK